MNTHEPNDKLSKQVVPLVRLDQKQCWLVSFNVEINYGEFLMWKSLNAEFFNEMFIIPISVSFFP